MMMLSSPRHRPEDLALWRKLELADRLNYRLRKVDKKVERSLTALQEFIGAGRCYLAVSWGKDSTVVAHLLWRLGREDPRATFIPTYRVYMPGIETPGTDEVETEFLRRFPLAYDRIAVPHDPEWVREEGRREHALSLGIEQAQRRANAQRYINGLRASESVVRRSRMRGGRLNTNNSCSPCGFWQTCDVFAYLAHHDLPVHPNYAMTAGGFWDRDKLRVCMLGNHRGRQYGRLLWEEWYYGDVLDQMRTLHPNMVPDG